MTLHIGNSCGLSPRAPCPCKAPNKTYYECCWCSAEPSFLDDTTGEIIRPRRLDDSFHRFSDRPAAPLAERSLNTENLPLRNTFASLVRGCDIGDVFCKMDEDVLIGTIERLKNAFLWRPDHWAIGPKHELLQRMKDWNTALERYCDDKNLVGSTRTDVTVCHLASPYAPCANPECQAIERKVHLFRLCAHCRTVGYCSRECQRIHWKASHKACCKKR